MAKITSLSIVIPVFNSEGSLRELVRQICVVLNGTPFELILVNDGSRDRSWSVICDLAMDHCWIRGINLMRNYGQHNALLCGIRAARHEIIVTMDDDLQNPPSEVPKLVATIGEGADVVYGKPRTETHGILRDIASHVTKLALQSTMGAETARSVSAFRAFRSELRSAFETYSGPFVSIDVLLTWGTQRFQAIPVENRPRMIGVSNYTVGKLIAHAMNMMTGFSTLPLQVASILGFVLTLFGCGIDAFVLIRYFVSGTSVPGFPFLASIISIFSGAQLFAIGVIGEYLARMHFRTMEKPTYAVRSTIDNFSLENRYERPLANRETAGAGG
jgi:glycosyltransferase involved in cell wall biosynthesis